MQRFDSYSTIHKGIRAKLFETAQIVARADFALTAQADAAGESVRQLLGFLEEHAEHEDRVLLPLLSKTAPGVYAELHSDHVRLDAIHHEVRGLLDHPAMETETARVAVGQKLHALIGRLVGEHLLHMGREESTGNRALWAHWSDTSLIEANTEIVSQIHPSRLAEWMEFVLPALSGPERARLEGSAIREVR